MSAGGPPWVGVRVPRQEDPALLSGAARFIDDLAPVPGIRHVALLRSPHAHAHIRSIDTAAALAIDGVVGALTGVELAANLKPTMEVTLVEEIAMYMDADDAGCHGERFQ